jgi:threonine aldolase
VQHINLRSDTQTLPTEEMRAAIRDAELGDDTYDDDPTVQKLEAMAAGMLGTEAALLTVSGTMANLVALMTHGRPGDEVIVDSDSHIFYYEVGSLASIAGLMPMPVPSHQGMLDPDQVRAAIRRPELHYPTAKLLCLENTHNRSGGRVVPPGLHRQLCEVAREHGLSIHLDGARIFNAAIAAGVPVGEYTRHVDSVMFCLSKGLSCPLGSVLCGSQAFIEQADRNRKRLGGGMRQAGVIAAAGLVALQTMIDRLAEDHAHARRLAEEVEQTPGLSVDLHTVETNMVYIGHAGTGLSTPEMVARLEDGGVLVSPRPPGHIRIVLNRHHDDAVIGEALKRIRTVLDGVMAV